MLSLIILSLIFFLVEKMDFFQVLLLMNFEKKFVIVQKNYNHYFYRFEYCKQ